MACSDAVDNRTYLLDENDNACLGWLSAFVSTF